MINQLSCSSTNQQKFKVVMLGDSGVGKTSIIQRIIYSSFDDRNKDTIGIDILKKTFIQGRQKYQMIFWDTAGQQKFHSLVSTYIKNADFAIITYDVNDKKTFTNCQKWLKYMAKYHEKEYSSILVGNKIDQQRQVDKNQVKKWAKTQGISDVVQVSAKTGIGFQQLIKKILKNGEKMKESESTKQSEGSKIQNPQKQPKKIMYKYKQPNSCCSI